MPGYLTVTGQSQATPVMGAGTSLFRKLVSVGSGFTINGWELSVFIGGQATTAATGLTAGSVLGSGLTTYGLSYGPSVFTPPNLVGDADATDLLWWGVDDDFYSEPIYPASTTWQTQVGYRMTKRARTCFRLAAASDFCFQVGNNASGSITFEFLATLRLYYA